MKKLRFLHFTLVAFLTLCCFESAIAGQSTLPDELVAPQLCSDCLSRQPIDLGTSDWQGWFKNQSFAQMQESSAREASSFGAAIDDNNHFVASFTSNSQRVNFQLVVLGYELEQLVDPEDNPNKTLEEQFVAVYHTEMVPNHRWEFDTPKAQRVNTGHVSFSLWLKEPASLDSWQVLGGWIAFKLPI